ncbi:MAG: N-acetylmuramoyl-L-alanine amidase [Clostridiales bacterium]|nr:N-acetylmuramoyl-L-alanine amidase [Clostridiales bacterium]
MNILNANLTFNGTPNTRTETKAIVLHHADAVSCGIEDIHRWHLANGWIGCGYHFLVRKDGSVWQGRPIEWVGAHAKGANEFSVGVCFEGSYESKDTVMPAAQIQAGKELVSYLLPLYPEASVKRHRDYCSTDCPGRCFPFDEIAQGDTYPKDSKDALTGDVSYPTDRADRSLLLRGSKGGEVKDLQTRLIKLGYSCGSCGADGVYGAGTEAAVKAFQSANGLTADGKCGPKTWAALDGSPLSAPTVPAAPVCPYPEPAVNVKRGGKGDGVRWVQWMLKQAGYDIGSTGIDGDCGSKTVAAITQFQKDHGLAADGICGVKTRAALKGV